MNIGSGTARLMRGYGCASFPRSGRGGVEKFHPDPLPNSATLFMEFLALPNAGATGEEFPFSEGKSVFPLQKGNIPLSQQFQGPRESSACVLGDPLATNAYQMQSYTWLLSCHGGFCAQPDRSS